MISPDTKVVAWGSPGTVTAAPEGSQDPAPEGCVWVVFDDPAVVARWGARGAVHGGVMISPGTRVNVEVPCSRDMAPSGWMNLGDATTAVAPEDMDNDDYKYQNLVWIEYDDPVLAACWVPCEWCHPLEH